MSNAIGTLIGDVVANYALISSVTRSIDTIIPDVIVEETHTDEMTITQHPVETGAPISDHAFMNPVTVAMRLGWSDSTGQAIGYVDTVYQSMLALQRERRPFNVSTGKRQYTNMLIKSIAVTTDESSENALNMNVVLQEAIITSTSTTGSTSAVASTDAANQTDPQQTAATVDAGTATLAGSTAGAPSFA